MKTDYEFLKTEVDGHILTVTINRPDRMNALHPPAHAEFDEVWNEFDKDENLWVGIVTVKVIALFPQETILSSKLKLVEKWISIWPLQVSLD